MNFINEYALLFAVALPVMTIAAIQASLLLAGERGTGLLPGFDRYPSMAIRAASTMTEGTTVVSEAANDDMERAAA
jgi:hypothetical protein